MTIIDWNETFSVGIASIDEQHKKLIDLVNYLNDQMSAGNYNDALEKVIDTLFGYAVQHFSTEESLFTKYNYPETIAHTIEHEVFIHKIQDFNKAFKEGRAMLGFETMEFLKSWIVNHILREDKKYGPFLNAKGVK